VVGVALIGKHRQSVTSQSWNSLLEACEKAIHGRPGAAEKAALTRLLTVFAHLLPWGGNSAASSQFLNSDASPWNLMAATAVIYPLSRIAIHCAFRRHMSSSLTMEV